MILILLIILTINTCLLIGGTLFSKRIYVNSINQITIYTIISLIFDLFLILIFFLNYTKYISLLGGGYHFIIIWGFILFFIIFLFSIYWQESTRNWFIDKIKQNQILKIYYLKSNILNLFKKKLSKLNQMTLSFEYYFIATAIIFLFPLLIYIKNLIIFYVIFEIIGILILILISFQLTNESIKGAILYFFFGFYSTLFLIWGFTLLYTNEYTLIYNQNIINQLIVNNNQKVSLEFYIAILLLIIAFLIKLGVFPYQTWVIEVYTRLSNINHLFFISFITVGYLFSFINLLSILYNIISNKQIWLIIVLIISISAVGSTLTGALLLYNQTTVKGFFASNSIITNGLLSLIILTLFEFKLYLNIATLLWYLFLYLIFYHIATYILFNSWNAILLSNFIKPLQLVLITQSNSKNKLFNLKKYIIQNLNSLVTKKYNYNKFINGIDNSFPLKILSRNFFYFINFIFFNNNFVIKKYSNLLNFTLYTFKFIYNWTSNFIKLYYYYLAYIFNKILLSLINFYLKIIPLIKVFSYLNKNLQKITIYIPYINSNFLISLPNTITNIYKDYYLYTFIWILFGFPPFILFILKFYLIINILSSGLILPIWLLLLITNIFVTGALCRILTLTTTKFNYLT